VYTIIFVGFVSLIAIDLLSIQSQTHIVQHAIAQSLTINAPKVNDNLEEKNNSKMVKAFGHFANNQIKDGIVTWIQGGFWELTINNITNDSSNLNNNNILINNNSSEADFIANFTMIKPDGSLSHNHNIENFISSKVIFTDKDIVVMGIADIYSDDDNNNEYKSVPLTIHLMGNKVLGLTIDVSKTEGHFSSPNEMFGTLISGVGLDTSATNDSIETVRHHGSVTNDSVEKESMTMMQH
jgi:hypothetical protein